ncbi:MAG TPA: flagellar hook-associated protein FlgK [Fibrobacteraceae bacterium]|nr:flagellar hook-associated protein FlgK [Fibrobacteraceae bacterium]
MSLISGLSIGKSGLNAAQLQLSVTGENITNADTDGYTRKVVSLTSSSRADEIYGEMGCGVSVQMIERVRNVFLDQQYNDQTSDSSYADTLATQYSALESIYNETDDTGIADALDDFWDAWSDVANNPSDKSSRETLVSTTTILIDRIQSASSELQEMKDTINDQIEASVDEINSIAQQISELNKAIVAAEGLDSSAANDSRDARDELLNELASIADIEYIEDSTGAVTVTLSGSMLVSPQSAFTLETSQETATNSDGTSYSITTMHFKGSSSTIEASGGSLAALVKMRDEVIPSYEEELDSMVSSLVTQVNALHLEGYTLYGLTGVNFFDPDGLTASTISLSAAVEDDCNNIAAAQGGSTETVSGVSVTSDAENTLTLTSINSKYRDLLDDSVVVYDSSGNLLEEGADADYVIDYELGTIQIINTTDYPSGSSFTVDFSYNTSGFSGSGDGNNALSIAGLRDTDITDPDDSGEYTHTLAEYFAASVGRLGVESSEAETSSETQESLLEQIESQVSSVSGVNLDEELTNMIKYQQSYNASAKFISTISDVLDTLMAI